MTRARGAPRRASPISTPHYLRTAPYGPVNALSTAALGLRARVVRVTIPQEIT